MYPNIIPVLKLKWNLKQLAELKHHAIPLRLKKRHGSAGRKIVKTKYGNMIVLLHVVCALPQINAIFFEMF
jgi:hypothetical protein